MVSYAKVVVLGSPISKSNFKLSNKYGRAILPKDTGTYHDRYFEYESSIIIAAKSQNPSVRFTESLIAILKVYYKSEKRHPDTNNITKSIFDGIEKSGLIINDAQIRRLIIEEYYDRVNPRFELELFKESEFSMTYEVRRLDEIVSPIEYGPPSNTKSIKTFKKEEPKRVLSPGRKRQSQKNNTKSLNDESELNNLNALNELSEISKLRDLSARGIHTSKLTKISNSNNKEVVCSICGKKITSKDYIKGNRGRDIICRKCLEKAL